jgi:hypothetical protein
MQWVKKTYTEYAAVCYHTEITVATYILMYE